MDEKLDRQRSKEKSVVTLEGPVSKGVGPSVPSRFTELFDGRCDSQSDRDPS